MLKPFFPFYGSKWRIAKLYPKPAYEVVYEPFAGSAGYSTYLACPKARLSDADPIIVGVWSYLIHVSEAEVLNLPLVQPGQLISDLSIPQEARWLIGFWVNRGSASPKNQMTAYSARTEKAQLVWGEKARERIASQLQFIRGWTIKLFEFGALPDEEGTWFVDPPYRDKGRYYRVRVL